MPVKTYRRWTTALLLAVGLWGAFAAEAGSPTHRCPVARRARHRRRLGPRPSSVRCIQYILGIPGRLSRCGMALVKGTPLTCANYRVDLKPRLPWCVQARGAMDFSRVPARQRRAGHEVRDGPRAPYRLFVVSLDMGGVPAHSSGAPARRLVALDVTYRGPGTTRGSRISCRLAARRSSSPSVRDRRLGRDLPSSRHGSCRTRTSRRR